jgi:putative PIN family toxin of toxin-antitoxin system
MAHILMEGNRRVDKHLARDDRTAAPPPSFNPALDRTHGIIYNTTMWRIVIDTNVFVAALLSGRGESFRLLSLLGQGVYQPSVSVPVVLEYEYAAKHVLHRTQLSDSDLDSILDYLCLVGDRRQIYFLWRPFLPDAHDDMILELAVAGECSHIVTFNQKHFVGVEAFGLQAITPQDFLRLIGKTP